MPQAPRKDASTQRAQDKESKRARGALSCAECRRLKLKCDKTVPCSSCKRRGCSAICPNGSLITGQGTRFVLADTEKLHQKIAHMSDRIRQLEDALSILHDSTHPHEPHPLLHRDLLKIKSSIELHAAVDGEESILPQQLEEQEESQYIDAFGTLAIRDDGASTFYGRSAGSESLLIGESVSPQPGKAIPSSGQPALRSSLPQAVTNLSGSFPLGSTIYQSGITLDHLVSTYLPSWQQAWRLCELYLEQAPWFFGAVTKRQLHEEILPLWYQEAKPVAGAASPVYSAPSPPGSESPNSSVKGGAHDLALLFVIFCFGALTDMELPPAPDNPEAEHYYQLTKAALTLEPVLERPPSVATVQTLSIMAIYEGLRSGENSIESTWALMGMATKLAQSIGLHRDCARWKLSPAEVQKRRALFWELFITDCWQSLATGRLATFSLPFVDCELPYDPDQTISDNGAVQSSFPFWKARFGAECVSAVVQGTLTSRAPKYSIILELDRKVRDMELPLYAQGPAPQEARLSETMSHYMPTNYRELTLLYIHRCFFAHAISTHPHDPIKSQYAPSFLAGYRSACTIIQSLGDQFARFPRQIARFWVLWTHAFSSSVMLASVATHSSKSNVAEAALVELGRARDLFERAATYGGRAVKFLPIIQRLQEKAQQTRHAARTGMPQGVHNDIFKPSDSNEAADELSIFSGKTHTLNTKVSTSTPSHSPRAASGSAIPAPSSRGSSDSPKQAYTDNPSFAGVHPSLVQELHGFDVRINSQVQDAYRANVGAYSQPMVEDSLQQQQQRDYQRQQELERQQLERRELERQQMEHQQQQQHLQQQQQAHQMQQRQLQLQQQMEQQQQQHPISHQHQQHALTHPHAHQAQQPEFHQHGQPIHSRYTHVPRSDSHGSIGPGVAAPAPPGHRNSLARSQSVSNLQQAYQQYPSSSQHQMYPPALEYPRQQRPEPMPSLSSASHYMNQDPPYNQNGQRAQGNQYWAAAPTAPMGGQYVAPHGYQQPYTPAAALQGIAADDRSLQETWQSYMYKVGSPRHLLED
ncbi:fungal-specific transcription factor domain-containing protein [Infundibulicybe gibba]|nr:fungal-specific transcription factor domain-containing protein [Infundibulicybe gibba]